MNNLSEIRLSVKLDSKNDIEKQLVQLINQLNNQEIKLNINTTTLKKNLQDAFNLDGVTKSAYSSAKVFEAELDSISDTIGKIREKSERKNRENNALQEAKEVNSALDERNKLEQQMAEIRSKADYNSKQREIVEQNQLNKSLKEEEDLINQIANKREQSENRVKKNDKTQELAQNKAINKALEDNYKATLNEAEAQKQVQSEIQKQIKLLEIKKQGILFKDSKADTSAIDDAISKYKQLNNLSMKDLRSEISYINAELRNSSINADSFMSKIGKGLSNIGIYINAGDIFRGIVNGAKDAISYVTDVENSMIDLRRVVDMSDSSANQFQQNMHNLSVEMASTNADTISTVASFSKLGYSIQDATKLGEITTKYNFAADINNIEDATTSLISTLKAYKIEAEGAEDVTNDINEVSNTYAVKAKDLNAILQRSSSTMSTFGNSLKQNISLGTVAQEITQDSERVGNALKSIGARITTNSNALDELKSMGISIEDVNGNLKSTYDIFKEMSPLIQKMKGSELARVSNNLFGKNQISVGLAIVQNYEKLDEVMQTLGNTTDSVNNEFDRYLNSTQAKVSQLKENMGGLYSQFINTNMTKGVVDGLNVFVTSITNIISKLGAFPTTIATVIASLSIFNSKFREMSTSYQPSKLTEFIGKLNGLSSVYKSQITTINENIIAQKTHISTQNQTGVAFFTSRAKLLQYQTQLGMATVAENACAIGAKALGVAFNMALGAGVGLVIQGLAEFANASEIAKQKNEELLSTIQQTKTDINSMSELETQFKSIGEALQSGTLTDDEALEKKKDLKTAYDQLIQACPQLEGALSLENGKYEDNIKLIKQAIGLKETQLKLDTEKYVTDNDVNDKGIQKQIDKIKELQKSIEGFSSKSLMTDDELLNSGNMTIFGKMFGSGDDRRKYFEQLKNDSKQELIDLQNDLQNELAKINSTEKLGIKIGVSEESKNNISQSIDIISQILNDGTQSLDDNTNSIKLNADTINLLRQAQEEMNNTGVVTNDTLDKLNEVCPELGINAQNASEILGDMSDAIDEAGDSADEASQRLDNLAKSFNSLSNTNSDIDSVIEDMKEFGGITEQTYGKIIDNPEILQALGQEGDTIQNLTKLQEENREAMEERIQQAVDTANGVNSSQQSEADSKVNTDNQKKQSDNDTNNQIRQNTSDTTTQNADNYGTDEKNFDVTSQNKNTLDSNFQSAWRGNTANSVNENADFYTTDYTNFKNATDAKNALLENFRSNLASMGGIFANAEDAINPLVNNLTSPWVLNANGSGGSEGITKALDDAFGTNSLNALKEYKQGLNEIAGAFDSVTGKKITTGNVQAPSIKKVSSSAPSMVKGNTGSSSKGSGGSSGKSDAEKWSEKIADLSSDIDIDRYADLNSQLEILDNNLNDNKNSLSGLTEGTKAYYDKQKEQIDIIKQQASTYSLLAGSYATERDELKQKLSQYGILTDATGKLTNAEAKLKYQQDLANNMSGNTETEYNAKKQQIDAIKELQENIKRYREVTESEIPKCTQKWDELNDSIIKTQREQLQNLLDSLATNLEKEYTKQKEDEVKALDDWYNARKETLEKEYQDDTDSLQTEKQKIVDEYDEQIKKLQEQLDALNDDTDEKNAKLAKLKMELSLWQSELDNNNPFAKNQINTLQQEITDLEKDIKKDNLQKEIDELKDKQSAESDYYDDKIDSLKNNNDDELDELEKSYKEQQEELENKYDDMLSEQNIYKNASLLITQNQQDEMIELLSKYDESYKNAGTLLGENFKEGLISQVQQAMSSLNSLTGGVLGSLSNSNNSDPKENNMATSSGTNSKTSNNSINGKSYTIDSNGNISSKDALSNEEIEEILKSVPRYATGGDISINGGKEKLIFAEDKEKVLNPTDSNTLNKLSEFVNSGTLDEIFNMANSINSNNMPTIPTNMLIPSNIISGMDFRNISNSNTNNNTTNGDININMENNINNNNLQELGINQRMLEKMIGKAVSNSISRFGGKK